MSMTQVEQIQYNALTAEQQLQVQELVLDKDMAIIDAIESVKKVQPSKPSNPVKKVQPRAPTEATDEWVTTQQIMIDTAYMDQIVAVYLSARMHMDGSTKLIHEQFISTSKGHGFRVREFGGNICIEKRKRNGSD